LRGSHARLDANSPIALRFCRDQRTVDVSLGARFVDRRRGSPSLWARLKRGRSRLTPPPSSQRPCHRAFALTGAAGMLRDFGRAEMKAMQKAIFWLLGAVKR
jgi:hypothetical protein